jgi:hypothetical protein
MNSLTQATTTQSASTATATTTTTPIDTTTTKKKYGKNLNKLTAPPVAPVAQGQSKPKDSSKNGYLLLSTKRVSSASNTGGILSSKSTQNTSTKTSSLGLHTEFSNSTHNALLGVVVGASRLEAQVQPDAWGVTEKADKAEKEQLQSTQEQVQQQVHEPAVVTKGNVDTSSHEGHFVTEEKVAADNSNQSNNQEGQGHLQEKERNNDENLHATSNWDEYGGREDLKANSNDGDAGNESTVDEANDVDQRVIMKKIARERAEKRRDEEENRMREQKERAAQRLRELEEKMAAKKKERAGKESEMTNNTSSGESSSRPSRFQLEELNNRKKENGTASSPKRESNQQQTLYDPNASSIKSYSALVTGSTSTKQERIQKKPEPTTKKQSLPLSPSVVQNGVQPQQGTYSADPESFDRQAVIQLASYDDRDRGDRNASATPRMLFDPKSGKMVDVNAREESSTKNRKERVKKGGKNPREKHSKKDLIADDKGGRKNKIRKDTNSMMNQRGKGVGGESSSTLKSDTRKVKITEPRKLPRTCGVLYSRDKKGGFYCVDGCEGDLGYGVHSVPGGRVKNSEVYSNYVDSQKEPKQENMVNYDSMNHERSLNSNVMEHENDVTLETGFRISSKVKEPKHDWIKSTDKIELITGVEDSPTLQATAREFAPTHRAIALAEREKIAHSSVGNSDDHDDDEEEDDDDDAPVSILF